MLQDRLIGSLEENLKLCSGYVLGYDVYGVKAWAFVGGIKPLGRISSGWVRKLRLKKGRDGRQNPSGGLSKEPV
jgi:hypothetical protein